MAQVCWPCWDSASEMAGGGVTGDCIISTEAPTVQTTANIQHPQPPYSLASNELRFIISNTDSNKVQYYMHCSVFSVQCLLCMVQLILFCV